VFLQDRTAHVVQIILLEPEHPLFVVLDMHRLGTKKQSLSTRLELRGLGADEVRKIRPHASGIRGTQEQYTIASQSVGQHY
jgi:hypothetical protein